ncbi:uncharacterized protein LOC110720366 isoform X2 [Chenopodium quinoa]|uniref:uncharacterized protein LOC110720366 isoform X2 n=1 Tax=Chenopodium quinoa TaxID=63459 RepID=UPI000B7813A3|nr:uncharacterized protein LOC110720366 isoform X2 [Chenopodium quinoa]
MAGGDETPPPPTKIEPNSPYYLGSQDRPGDFITPTRLTADNYDSWAADIQTALEARRKFDFLDGTINKPSPPCTKSDWTTINAMLISWITNTIDPQLKSSLSKFREAKPFWDHLKQRFSQTNGPRIQQLRSSIAKCEQSKLMIVSEYFGKLHILWQELDRHEPLISCSCCASCSAGRLHEERRAQARLHDFLMGLYPDYYSSLRTNILSQDPLPSLDRAYQLVTQEERVRTSRLEAEIKADSKPTEAVGFAVRANPDRGRGRDKPVCSKCRKTGHEASSCWADKICNHCKKQGHPETHCYELVGRTDAKRSSSTGQGRGQVRANAATSGSVSSSSSNSSVSALGKLFTPEQWKAIAGVVGNANIPDNRLTDKFDVSSWIIDTGATHHVTGDSSWLFDTQKLDCPVGLPNGSQVVATLVGSVYLSDKITLTGVLYVPTLS